VRELEAGPLHVYDRGGDGLPVLWHHGTPNLGLPPEPLFADADRLGLRWVSYDRPGYGGSPREVGRGIASAVGYARVVADALGIERFAVMGHSGGGTHALAVAAMLPERVVGVASLAALAPFGAEGFDWFAGMAPVGVAALSAAARGRAAREAFEEPEGDSDIGFHEGDWAALAGEWSWFGKVVGPAPGGGQADDDVAYVSAWGFDPGRIAVPVLLMHGGRDRMVPTSHGEWLARHIPHAEWRLSTEDGHITVLNKAPQALEWLAGLSSGR
jgi:pimeloyl-ACP methyl ester carboxylesterase